MHGCWRDNKAGRGKQTFQLIPMLDLVFVFRILFGITAVEGSLAHHPNGSLVILQIGDVITKLLFPKKQAIVACYARVGRVDWIQSKAEAGGPRISPLRRVRENVAETRSRC